MFSINYSSNGNDRDAKKTRPINLPKFASITQIFLTLGHIWSFLHFFSLMWLHWAVSWFFQRVRTSSYNLCEKSYIWVNIGAKGGNTWPKICRCMIYAVTNSAITSEVSMKFSWNKKRGIKWVEIPSKNHGKKPRRNSTSKETRKGRYITRRNAFLHEFN